MKYIKWIARRFGYDLMPMHKLVLIEHVESEQMLITMGVIYFNEGVKHVSSLRGSSVVKGEQVRVYFV